MPGSLRKRADRGKNVYELRVILGRDDYGRVRHKSTIFRGPLGAAEMELARLVTEQAAEPTLDERISGYVALVHLLDGRDSLELIASPPTAVSRHAAHPGYDGRWGLPGRR